MHEGFVKKGFSNLLVPWNISKVLVLWNQPFYCLKSAPLPPGRISNPPPTLKTVLPPVSKDWLNINFFCFWFMNYYWVWEFKIKHIPKMSSWKLKIWDKIYRGLYIQKSDDIFLLCRWCHRTSVYMDLSMLYIYSIWKYYFQFISFTIFSSYVNSYLNDILRLNFFRPGKMTRTTSRVLLTHSPKGALPPLHKINCYSNDFLNTIYLFADNFVNWTGIVQTKYGDSRSRTGNSTKTGHWKSRTASKNRLSNAQEQGRTFGNERGFNG